MSESSVQFRKCNPILNLWDSGLNRGQNVWTQGASSGSVQSFHTKFHIYTTYLGMRFKALDKLISEPKVFFFGFI